MVDILREHFARCGFGFKRITFAIDTVERTKPRFEVDIKLDPYNKPKGVIKRIDTLYNELMSICKKEVKPESAILIQLYKWVQDSKIDGDEFVEIVQRFKGL